MDFGEVVPTLLTGKIFEEKLAPPSGEVGNYGRRKERGVASAADPVGAI